MRHRKLLLIFFATVISLAQVSSSLLTPEIRRVGSRLACLCGSCKNSVADCAMLECHYAKPAREMIRDMLARGMSDDEIVADFIRREGKRALAVPPSEGFYRLAWWMTPIMAGAGLLLIYWYLRRARKSAPAAAQAPQLLERYRDSIEKDLAKFDS